MQRLHASKPLHGPFSSSKRLMRILGAVEPTTGLPAIGVADLFHRRGITAKPVGDDAQRSTATARSSARKDLQHLGSPPMMPTDRPEHRHEHSRTVVPDLDSLLKAQDKISAYRTLAEARVPAHRAGPVTAPLPQRKRGEVSNGPSENRNFQVREEPSLTSVHKVHYSIAAEIFRLQPMRCIPGRVRTRARTSRFVQSDIATQLSTRTVGRENNLLD